MQCSYIFLLNHYAETGAILTNHTPVIWLKYCLYGVKPYTINQSINESINEVTILFNITPCRTSGTVG